MYTVLTEGFTFRDVTNLTGVAKWGSYAEDAQFRAQLTDPAEIRKAHPYLVAEKGLLHKKPPIAVKDMTGAHVWFDGKVWDARGGARW